MELVIILAIMVAAMFWLSSRNRKQQKAQSAFRDNLEPGQEVMTGSGMYGTVVEVHGDAVTLETAPGVTSRWYKPAIAKLVEPPVEEEPEEPEGAEEEFDEDFDWDGQDWERSEEEASDDDLEDEEFEDEESEDDEYVADDELEDEDLAEVDESEGADDDAHETEDETRDEGDAAPGKRR
ncbi:preprotein translocase subunit YajC [Isoptericola sp. b441]|uniref:Preprotein translocase subunit YajC n=1 Tax=Actinotalea lenta TaxID=3064654 RepID=A0ABT9DEJ2_9CELL|nr:MULTISPECIES: preprotein translocase subunit YajC [unclassified Isoptericola]MDO8107818.1 preprotein translocase subunit YajC [Isoptericola sp. b441]MDO8120511.1 preprotein translocase subunit YajC [Isoptericola sp. b490]